MDGVKEQDFWGYSKTRLSSTQFRYQFSIANKCLLNMGGVVIACLCVIKTMEDVGSHTSGMTSFSFYLVS